MVLPASHKVPRVSWYSGYCPPAPGFGYGAFTLSGRLSQNLSPAFFRTSRSPLPRRVYTAVWAPSVSLAATPEIDFSFFSSGYLDVSVHRVPFTPLLIHAVIPGCFPGGFPHSDIRGSMDICSSPRLFAAYHVFLRLLVPRHPPCALLCLTIPCYGSSLPSHAVNAPGV